MGFNTALMVLNDRLDEIRNDPHFGRRVSDAVMEACHRKEKHFGSFSMLPTQHADTVQVISVGFNSINLLGYAWSDDPEIILRGLANQYGYRLVKRRKLCGEQSE